MLSKQEVISQARANRDYTGVYFLIKNNIISYIGSSFRIGQRIKAHYGSALFDCYSFVEVRTGDKLVLRSVEADYILKFNPPNNYLLPHCHKYMNINTDLLKECVSIKNVHKATILAREGFEIFWYSGTFKTKALYVLRKDSKAVRLCLMRNFAELEEMQKSKN